MGHHHRNARRLLALVLALAFSALDAADGTQLFDRRNLVAWCIVPFDALKRGPAERAEVVRQLGLRRIAYDWRAEHVPQFEPEIVAYRQRGLEFFAFWSSHERAFELFRQHGLQPQFWQTAPSPAGTASRDEQIRKSAAQLLPQVERAHALGSAFGLYNHGGWGGRPENLVAVCERLRAHHRMTNVGIVYNLHHAHEDVDHVAEALAIMKPYLLCLNLNGMTRDGDKRGLKILPLGQGELDLVIMRQIAASGYGGPIGILGHSMDDMESRLRDNLEGLDWLVAQLDGAPAGPKPTPRVPRPNLAAPATSVRSKPGAGQ
jgi:hypothetical protein